MASRTGVRATVANGDAVVFLGDSLTYDGWAKKDGWVRQLVALLAARTVRIRPDCAGVSGDRSVDMRARFGTDVIARRPDWLVLNCGVNDVWHGPRGCTLSEFRDNVAAMLDGAIAAGIAVVCGTATIIGEDLTSPANRAIDAYNDELRILARERGVRLADCSRAFREALTALGARPGAWLTEDGVHLNTRGEATMARAILDGWGVGAG